MLRNARVGTRDLAAARIFYDAVAATLGAARVFSRDELTGYQGPSGAALVVGVPLKGEATVGNGSQLVLEAATRAAVDAAHAAALAQGGTCEGPPGFRSPPENNFYAAYFRDLDGNKLVVACFKAE